MPSHVMSAGAVSAPSASDATIELSSTPKIRPATSGTAVRWIKVMVEMSTSVFPIPRTARAITATNE